MSSSLNNLPVRTATTSSSVIHIGVLVFDNVEDLDFAGPVEVFSSANAVMGNSEPKIQTRFQIHFIGFYPDDKDHINESDISQSRPITTLSGMRILPEFTTTQLLNSTKSIILDVLIIPGGPIIDPEPPSPKHSLERNEKLHKWLQTIVLQGQNQSSSHHPPHMKLSLLFTICSGALIPAFAGLFKEINNVTTHHHFLQSLRVGLRVAIGMKESEALQEAKKSAKKENEIDITDLIHCSRYRNSEVPIVQASNNSRYVAHFQAKPVPILMSGGVSAGIDAGFAALQYLLTLDTAKADISINPIEVIKQTRYRMEYYYGIDPSFFYAAADIDPLPK